MRTYENAREWVPTAREQQAFEQRVRAIRAQEIRKLLANAVRGAAYLARAIVRVPGRLAHH